MYYRNALPVMAYPQLQQTAMYQHAMYQNQRLRQNYQRRSATSGVAAFAAGDNIATGTILKGKFFLVAQEKKLYANAFLRHSSSFATI